MAGHPFMYMYISVKTSYIVLYIKIYVFLHLIVNLAHSSVKTPDCHGNGMYNGWFNFTSRFSGAFIIVCIVHGFKSRSYKR
jgi:hypothetical protein